jgi:orotidine-5'-phosphate decarboxylase
MKAKDRLIVALDVPTEDKALKLVDELQGLVGMFKVGSQLFTATGPGLVERIVGSGNRVFLDLKFHDIPHQVGGAVASATKLGVSLLTVHASGGPDMLLRASESAKETADRERIERPNIVAVTVLTSMDSKALNEIGVTTDANESAKRLALLAASARVDGVVASPQEIGTIRSTIPNADFLIVTPGIRPIDPKQDEQLVSDDQKRVATPGFALAAGANYLVVGRPITGAADVAEAATRIVGEMEISIAPM